MTKVSKKRKLTVKHPGAKYKAKYNAKYETKYISKVAVKTNIAGCVKVRQENRA